VEAVVVANGDLCVLEGSHGDELVKFLRNKVCGSNGDLFTGHVDAVTGELITGKRMYMITQECYEGPFVRDERHGLGVCTKLNGEGKFLGTFRRDSYHRGTLVTKHYTYVGFFFEGVFHGDGTLIRSNGTLYEGNFEKGVFHGHGKLTSPNGDRYEGGFRDGKKQGDGTICYPNGGIYMGDWKKDHKDGVGQETINSKQKYLGEYVNDMRHGKGTLKTPAAILTGPWRKGKPLDGPGWTVCYPKYGIQYTGDALSCRPHGHGVFTFRNEDSEMSFVYEGNVLCGLRHGTGRMISGIEKNTATWKGDTLVLPDEDHLEVIEESSGEEGIDHSAAPSLEEIESSCSDSSRPESEELEEDNDIKVYSNGDTFRGHIDIFDKRQGFGILTESSTGMCFSGQWKSSRKHGRGTLDQPLSGVQYMGSFIEDVMEGNGSLRLPDGSKYSGKFVDGMMYGKGTFHDSTYETVYTGDFVKSVKHGHGEEEYPDNTVYCGTFVNGKRSSKNGSLYRVNKDGGRALLYQGEWANNCISGEGKKFELETPCAGSYAGTLSEGKRHDHGTFTAKDGFIFEGEWSNDSPVDGDWVITCPKGSVYYGGAICKDGIPIADGFGTHNENEGTFYSGGFRMGHRHGSGLCVFSSGEQWDGRWEDGVFAKYGRSRP